MWIAPNVKQIVYFCGLSIIPWELFSKIIMRNKILFVLFHLTFCDILDSVLPRNCVWVRLNSTICNSLYFCFSDEDLGDVCEGHCENDYVDCSISCISDTNCLIECGRAFNACVLGINCALWFYTFLIHKLWFKIVHAIWTVQMVVPIVLIQCVFVANILHLKIWTTWRPAGRGKALSWVSVFDCKNEQACENGCLDLFKTEYEKCPCQVTAFRSLTVASLSPATKSVGKHFLGWMSRWLSLRLFWLRTRKEISPSVEHVCQ